MSRATFLAVLAAPSAARQTSRMTRFAVLAAASLALAAPARGQTTKSWTDFTHAFQAYVDSDHVVGASVVYVRDGRMVMRYDAGMQDRAGGVHVDSQTI